LLPRYFSLVAAFTVEGVNVSLWMPPSFPASCPSSFIGMAAVREPPPATVPAFVPTCPPLLPRATCFRNGRRVGGGGHGGGGGGGSASPLVGVGVAPRPRAAVRPSIGGRHGGWQGRGGGGARHAVMMAENYATAEGQSIEEVRLALSFAFFSYRLSLLCRLPGTRRGRPATRLHTV